MCQSLRHPVTSTPTRSGTHPKCVSLFFLYYPLGENPALSSAGMKPSPEPKAEGITQLLGAAMYRQMPMRRRIP